jgi:tetratricopeptide (TPR) repeat protein
LAAAQILKSLPEIGSDRDRGKEYFQAIYAYLKSSNNFRLGVIFYNDLGVQFAARGFFEAAIAAFSRAIELDPLYDGAHFNLGLAYWKKGLPRKAIFEFKSALKINPNHLKAKEFLTEIIYKKY